MCGKAARDRDARRVRWDLCIRRGPAASIGGGFAACSPQRLERAQSAGGPGQVRQLDRRDRQTRRGRCWLSTAATAMGRRTNPSLGSNRNRRLGKGFRGVDREQSVGLHHLCAAAHQAVIEEIAGVIWRKRRLRLAEAASHRRGIQRTTAPYSHTLDTALNQVERTLPLGPIIDAVSATPSVTAKDLAELKRRNASLHRTRNFERGKTRGLRNRVSRTRRTNADIVARTTRPEPEETDDEDPDEDSEPYTADATGLAEYLERSVLPECEEQLTYVENRSVIRRRSSARRSTATS